MPSTLLYDFVYLQPTEMRIMAPFDRWENGGSERSQPLNPGHQIPESTVAGTGPTLPWALRVTQRLRVECVPTSCVLLVMVPSVPPSSRSSQVGSGCFRPPNTVAHPGSLFLGLREAMFHFLPPEGTVIAPVTTVGIITRSYDPKPLMSTDSQTVKGNGCPPSIPFRLKSPGFVRERTWLNILSQHPLL